MGKLGKIVRTPSLFHIKTKQMKSTLARFAVPAIVLISLLIQCPVASAANIIVSRDDANASDTNTGTRKWPLKTIAAGLSAAFPGDKVIVLAGDYRTEDTGWGEGVIPAVGIDGGTDRIQLVAARGQSVVLNKLLIRNSTGLLVRGFCFTDRPFYQVPNWLPMPCTVRDAEFDSAPDYTSPYSTREQRVEEEFSTYLGLMRSLEFETAIAIEGSRDIKVLGNQIEGYWAGIQCNGAESIQIKSNQISCTSNGIFTFAPNPGLKDAVISGNYVTQSLDNGIDIRAESENVLVQGNLVTFSGRSHISFQDGVTNSKISDNYLCFGGYYAETMVFPGASGISTNGTGEGISIERNIVLRQQDATLVDGNGMIVDLVLPGSVVVVKDNISAYNDGAGLNTTVSPNCLIQGNVFLQNGFTPTLFSRGAGIKLSRSQDIGQTITGNYFLLNRSASINSSFTIRQQTEIDRNVYFSFAPLIWDGDAEGENTYSTIRQVRKATGWEMNGISFPFWWFRY